MINIKQNIALYIKLKESDVCHTALDWKEMPLL